VHLGRRALLGGLAALTAAPAWARLTTIPAPSRELMVPVTGGRVFVTVTGDLNAARPPLVIAHGGPGGTHRSYLEALALADERAVILYDQLDSGRSDWPQDPANWTVPRFVDELEAIRAALGVGRWHVLGHSWGGTIALEYGARRPAGLASLILASPLISTRSWIADADALRAELPEATRTTISACEGTVPPSRDLCDAATAEFYRTFNGREPASALAKAYAEADKAAGSRGFDARLYETMWGSSEFVSTGTLRDYDGEPLLVKLDGPRTLFMVGQYDEARPVTAIGFARQMPGAELAVIPGAAHGLFGDRPDETIGVLRGWLARHDAA
jgi:proline-specific peptidase